MISVPVEICAFEGARISRESDSDRIIFMIVT